MRHHDSIKSTINRIAEGGDIWSFNPGLNGGIGGYILESPGSDTVEFPNTINRTVRYDYKAWEFPHMQDYVSSRWALNWAYDPAFPSLGGNTIAGLASDHYFYIGSNRVQGFSTNHILNRMIGRNSLPFDPRNMSWKAEDAFARLSKSPITRVAQITQEDPLDSEFSLWFLLADLVQLKGLAQSLIRLAKLRNYFKKGSTFREISQSHLTIQFGLLPTIADIRDFITILSKWASHVQTAKKFSEALYTAHNPIVKLGNVQWEADFFFRRGVGVDATASIAIEQSRWLCQTTKYYFVHPDLSDWLSRLKQLVDQLGLLDPTVLWDILPWSFIIDWVVDVSGWVRSNLKPRLLPVDLVICDWCESIYHSSEITGTLQYVTRAHSGAADQLVKCHIGGTYTGGARKRQFPSHLSIDRRKPLFKPNSLVTLRHTFLGAALIGARNKVKKRVGKAGDYHRRNPRGN